MPLDLASLKSELETDPVGYGYAPYIAAGNMQTLADMLNQLRANILVPPLVVIREQVLACWDLLEVEASYADDPARLELACHAMRYPRFNLLNKDPDFNFGIDVDVLEDLVQDAFTNAGYISSDAMGTITSRTGSRAEELWDSGTVITWYNCSQALSGAVLI